MQRSLTYRPFLLVLACFSLFTGTAKPEAKVSKAVLSETEIPLNVTQVALGGLHSTAAGLKGKIFSWGYNNYGQLGDGANSDRKKPFSISDKIELNVGEEIAQVSYGYNHSTILTSTSRVFTWGRNDYGQLGNNSVVSRSTPDEITSKFNLAQYEIITRIICLGSNHSAALSSNNRVFLWGNNNYGQIGNNTTENCLVPTDITSYFHLHADERVVKVVTGEFHSGAFTTDGRVFTWGLNKVTGQLGDGTDTNRLVPTDITSQFNLHSGETIIDLSLGGGHSSALSSEFRVFTWGNNVNGQLGDGSSVISRWTPSDITPQFGIGSEEAITQVCLRGANSSALTTTGRVFTWGDNSFGQLGDGTLEKKSTPIDITAKFDLVSDEIVMQVSLGFGHAAAVTTAGRLFTWGRNNYGQLGNGTTVDVNTPTIIDVVPSTEDPDTPPTPTPAPNGDYSWAWWFLLLLLIPAGYFVYRYRKNIAGLFKKKKQ